MNQRVSLLEKSIKEQRHWQISKKIDNEKKEETQMSENHMTHRHQRIRKYCRNLHIQEFDTLGEMNEFPLETETIPTHSIGNKSL